MIVYCMNESCALQCSLCMCCLNISLEVALANKRHTTKPACGSVTLTIPLGSYTTTLHLKMLKIWCTLIIKWRTSAIFALTPTEPLEH